MLLTLNCDWTKHTNEKGWSEN